MKLIGTNRVPLQVGRYFAVGKGETVDVLWIKGDKIRLRWNYTKGYDGVGSVRLFNPPYVLIPQHFKQYIKCL